MVLGQKRKDDSIPYAESPPWFQFSVARLEDGFLCKRRCVHSCKKTLHTRKLQHWRFSGSLAVKLLFPLTKNYQTKTWQLPTGRHPARMWERLSKNVIRSEPGPRGNRFQIEMMSIIEKTFPKLGRQRQNITSLILILNYSSQQSV